MQNKMARDRESKSANEVAPAAISSDLHSKPGASQSTLPVSAEVV